MIDESTHIPERLAKELSDDDRIHTVWLFGSRARDEHDDESDLDLAVWCDEPLSFDEKLRLRASVQKAGDQIEVDVVFLDDAGPVLRYEVVRDGRRLFTRDRRTADDFAHRTAMKYLDTAHYRELQQRLAREALE